MSRKISCKPKKILRNKLDFLLTDLLPYEIPDLFSFVDFYNFILENRKEFKTRINRLKQTTSANKEVPFRQSWASLPLRYEIKKGDSGYRKMSLINPLSALNAYFFLELYEDLMLRELEAGRETSLRYHTRNKELYYRGRTSGGAAYFYNRNKAIRQGREEIQQSGAYFRIKPYNSVQTFTESKKWLLINSKYVSFAHLDFKNCFDSIYNHVYTWIYARDVIDSKKANNANLYVAIDRLLQNLNGHLSHGVLVGPEFSRLLVELLMQKNDSALILKMKNQGYIFGKDYEFYRYVDDVFLFAKSETILEQAKLELEAVSRERHLSLNDSKTQFLKCPVYLDDWLDLALRCADEISTCFSSDLNDCYCYMQHKVFNRLVSSFYSLINSYPDKKRKIVSYLLSTVLRSLQRKKSSVPLFKANDNKSPFKLLRYCFFLLSHAPVFEHFQKVISIMDFVYSECGYLNSQTLNYQTQKIIFDYEQMLNKTTLSDISNFIIILNDFNLHLSSGLETNLEEKVLNESNPLIMASWLYYSTYDADYRERFTEKILPIIDNKIQNFYFNDAFMDEGMWFIYVFIKCPFITKSLKKCMIHVLDNIIKIESSNKNKNQEINLNNYVKILICNYLKSQRSSSFFDWGAKNVRRASQIAYRTYSRTIFRGYAKRYAFSY